MQPFCECTMYAVSSVSPLCCCCGAVVLPGVLCCFLCVVAVVLPGVILMVLYCFSWPMVSPRTCM